MTDRYRTARQYLKSLGPVALWGLGEKSGSALDATGNGHHGTVTAAEGQRGAAALDDRGDGALRFEEGTTNLIPNPSAETGVTGWSVTRLTVTQSDEQASSGTYSFKCVSTGTTSFYLGEQVAITGGGTAGRDVTGALDLFVDAGNSAIGKTFRLRLYEQGGASAQAATTVDVIAVAGWNRFEVTRELVQNDRTHVTLEIGLDGGAQTSDVFYVDRAQVEEKDHATSYCDGSLGTGYSWASTAHASASTRVKSSVAAAADSAFDDFCDDGGAVAGIFTVDSLGANNLGRLFDKAGVPQCYTTTVSGGAQNLSFQYAFSGTTGQWSTGNVFVQGRQYAILWLYDNGDVANNPTLHAVDLSSGVLTTYTVGSGLTENTTPVGTRTSNTSAPFTIGNLNPAGADRAWDGLIDEVAIWKGTQPTLAEFRHWVRLVLAAERIALAPARVYLHDGSFRRIGQLTTATSINRSYRVDGGHGQASVELAVDDPLIARTKDQGNVLVIESSVYPEPWVGKIIRRRGSRAAGIVSLEAKSFDAILDERILPTGFTTTGSAGGEMARIIATVNARNGTGISIGDIQNHIVGVAALAFPEWTARRALDAIAEQSGLEWWLEYEATPTNIEIRFRAARNRGFNRYRQASLVDGGNCTWTDWTDEFEASAFALTVIAGQTTVTESFTERSRSTRIVEEGGGFVTTFETVQSSEDVGGGTVQPGMGSGQQSRTDTAGGAHGFITIATTVQAPTTRREVVEIREEVKTRDIAAQAAQALLRRRRLAEKVVSIVHIEPGEWDALDLGSVLRLVAPDAFVEGFDGPARILGVQPMEELGECELVLELLEDPEAA